jgi:hypothetical protein
LTLLHLAQPPVPPHLQELLHLLENGQVSIHLCPRATMTGETPCGHYVRAWAVLAPLGAAPAGAGTLVTASGQFFTTGASNITRTMTATTGTNLTGISDTGRLLSNRADGGGAPGAATAALHSLTSGLALGRTGTLEGTLPRWAHAGAGAAGTSTLSSFPLERQRRNRRASIGGPPTLDNMRLRRIGEISQVPFVGGGGVGWRRGGLVEQALRAQSWFAPAPSLRLCLCQRKNWWSTKHRRPAAWHAGLGRQPVGRDGDVQPLLRPRHRRRRRLQRRRDRRERRL